ncbi:hypothetical protein Goarm_022316 [Gossypium armourianum]|uniref:Uncharacterized protein n=1 Tax=Gossypium armourianum TaxID=34283 RepID=A0A7J9KEU7_9ROSI|nr:hypothetical protein [Gossypium armourianum]
MPIFAFYCLAFSHCCCYKPVFGCGLWFQGWQR